MDRLRIDIAKCLKLERGNDLAPELVDRDVVKHSLFLSDRVGILFIMTVSEPF